LPENEPFWEKYYDARPRPLCCPDSGNDRAAHPLGDFKIEAFDRMLKNAIQWAITTTEG
jgi:hypothetical protein